MLKRFPLVMPQALHRTIKTTAAQQGTTMTALIIAAVEAYLKEKVC